MANFSLLDVASPYVFAGAAIADPLHDLLTVLFVQDVETSFDDNGVVVSGMARFSVDVNSGPLRYTPPAGFDFNNHT
jgi:large repetitive protein